MIAIFFVLHAICRIGNCFFVLLLPAEIVNPGGFLVA